MVNKKKINTSKNITYKDAGVDIEIGNILQQQSSNGQETEIKLQQQA